jgi:hypothetical protein
VRVAASTMWEIVKDAGIDPAPERASTPSANFLRSQADALLACDFFETVTLSGTQMYVFAVIEHGSRRIRILGATAHLTASWVVQAAKNLVMDLQDAGCRARFLIRDRDGKYPKLFDTVLKDAGIEAVLSGVRMPRMNSSIERWMQTCRRELLAQRTDPAPGPGRRRRQRGGPANRRVPGSCATAAVWKRSAPARRWCSGSPACPPTWPAPSISIITPAGTGSGKL